jgi:hypothetical protein
MLGLWFGNYFMNVFMNIIVIHKVQQKVPGPNFDKNKYKIKSYDENNPEYKEKRKSNEFFDLNFSHRNLPTIF